ncbi:SDR family oxidoreductase [bacterium]|nr:SDR family oxidoreductase [bacterium]
MTHGRVQGKVALVTGGASGIGAAAASLMHDEGAEVVITDIHEPQSPETSEALTFFHHDISEEDTWKRVIGQTVDRYGKLDILVNCAGINGTTFNEPQDPEHLGIEQFRRVMRVNAEGTFLGCKHGIAVMKDRGGSIVNVGSLSAILTLPGMLDYASSKSVIRYLTKAVALHCLNKGYNIRCNLVSPGAIYTPLWDPIFAKCEDRTAYENTTRDTIPMKRWGMPIDVAYAILYLASDEAKHVTGTNITVDGGQLVSGQGTRGR